ncbi:hypothetical protein BGZ68_002309 [Mortierella alpina]|nr:hypothetical protein BGZ68_002309 [Mortierella alpina]
MPRAVSSTTKKRLQKRAVEAAPSSEENRVRHLYKAYETILNSESQLPMFLNHHEQPGSKKRTRKQEQHQQDSQPTATNTVAREDTAGSRQRAIDNTRNKARPLKPSPQLKQTHKNLRDPRKAPQAQPPQQSQKRIKGAEQRDHLSSFRKLVKVGNKTLDKSTARARIEDGISTIKTMFDSVFGSDALGLVPDSILQAEMPVLEEPQASSSIALVSSKEGESSSPAPEHCQVPTSSSVPAPCSAGGTDTSKTLQKALHELEHTLDEAAAAAAVVKDSNSENDSIADHSSTKTKKSVIVINDHEYEHEREQADDGHHDSGFDKSIADQTPRMEPAPAPGPSYMDSESEEFILPFMNHRPSTKAFDLPGSDLFFTGTAFQRIVASFALVLLGLFLFLLVISYKMQARRRTASSPFAFMEYMTKGILSSPFPASSPTATSSNRSFWTRRRPSNFAKSPTSLLGRYETGAVLPEPVVASSSSSKTGSLMTDLRRTSASQHHLQQQLQTAQAVNKAPV